MHCALLDRLCSLNVKDKVQLATEWKGCVKVHLKVEHFNTRIGKCYEGMINDIAIYVKCSRNIKIE